MQTNMLCSSQFITTLTNNIEALTGSPVNVTIDSYADGSVTANITTEFLDNNQASAQIYSNVMKSGDPSKVFGTGYGSVSVDPNSVQTVQVSNPARKSPCVNLMSSSMSITSSYMAWYTCTVNMLQFGRTYSKAPSISQKTRQGL